jgi:hypothetical protein
MSNPWIDAISAVNDGAAPPLHAAVVLSDPRQAERAWQRLGQNQLTWAVGSVPRLGLAVVSQMLDAIAQTPEQFMPLSSRAAVLISDMIRARRANDPTEISIPALWDASMDRLVSIGHTWNWRELDFFESIGPMLTDRLNAFDSMRLRTGGQDAIGRLVRQSTSLENLRALRPLPTLEELMQIAERR